MDQLPRHYHRFAGATRFPDIEVLPLEGPPAAFEKLLGKSATLRPELFVVIWQQSCGVPLAEDVLRGHSHRQLVTEPGGVPVDSARLPTAALAMRTAVA